MPRIWPKSKAKKCFRSPPTIVRLRSKPYRGLFFLSYPFPHHLIFTKVPRKKKNLEKSKSPQKGSSLIFQIFLEPPKNQPPSLLSLSGFIGGRVACLGQREGIARVLKVQQQMGRGECDWCEPTRYRAQRTVGWLA